MARLRMDGIVEFYPSSFPRNKKKGPPPTRKFIYIYPKGCGGSKGNNNNNSEEKQDVNGLYLS